MKCAVRLLQPGQLTHSQFRWRMATMVSKLYRPLARHKGLFETLVGDELIILDTARNRVMALSPALTRLFQLCSGKETVAEISDVLAAELAVDSDPSLIWAGLRRLEKAALLEGGDPPFPSDLDLRSRREVLKAIGLGAGALAFVLLPTPANAASCLPNGGVCISNAQCCSGRCCNSNSRCGTGGPGC